MQNSMYFYSCDNGKCLNKQNWQSITYFILAQSLNEAIN